MRPQAEIAQALGLLENETSKGEKFNEHLLWLFAEEKYEGGRYNTNGFGGKQRLHFNIPCTDSLAGPVEYRW